MAPRGSCSLSGTTPLLLCCVVLAAVVPGATPWRHFKSWSDAQWCHQVEEPLWPYAYSKYGASATSEAKGLTASNQQNMGHSCALRGSRSKCHICEPIACGTGLSSTCSYQLQGADYPALPVNYPAVSDTPFAVGPTVQHRNDFSRATRVCVILSGGACIASDGSTTDYSTCAVRCWGAGSPAAPLPFKQGWTYNSSVGLPQGRVTTLAGRPGVPGYSDGPAASAQFRKPQGVAVDRAGNTYVADTENHVIRVITPGSGGVGGTVGTVAGSGRAGYKDGLGKAAQFSSPVGLAVYERCLNSSGLDAGPVDGAGKNGRDGSACSGYMPVLVVADTANHRIRLITNVTSWAAGGAKVTTLAGGGNTTLDDLEKQQHGLADGQGSFARFDSPSGVAADNEGNVFVADTRNNVIRWVTPGGRVTTLAGTVQPQRKPLPGCAFPCVHGVAGYVDGPVNASRFTAPYAIALGPGSSPYSLLVADGHRVRVISADNATTGLDWRHAWTLGGAGSALFASQDEISTYARVYTLSGALVDGEDDGDGTVARFDQPRGIAVSLDGRVYVSDAAQCRVRRISVGGAVARPLSCSQRLVDIVRPSGCTGYDQPTDAIDRLASPWEGHIQYNGNSSAVLVNARATHQGRLIRRCQGVPPPDRSLQANGTTVNSTAGTLSDILEEDEDGGAGTQMLVYCPPSCAGATGATVFGGANVAPLPASGRLYYGDRSSVCAAAVHAGEISNTGGGYVTVTLHKGFGPHASDWRAMSAGGDGGDTKAYLLASTSNGVTSLAGTPAAYGGMLTRSFSVKLYPHPLNSTVTHTIAGAPAAPLGGSCGYGDGQPPLTARFSGPAGLAIFKGHPSASNTSLRLVHVSDSYNHVVRALTAVCTQACENGGTCTGPDKCTCTAGWAGPDCTTPVCTTPCAARQVCTAPNTCTCAPGFTGAACSTPQCVQTCYHGGVCSAPDTCRCAPGWFDANCTTPVCAQTCGNGGNCTGPNTCTCPAMWSGPDCRQPVCTQPCLNGGVCTAPDTCTCQPSWSGHDCSKPVCHQGFFRADPYPKGYAASTWRNPSWKQFIPCSYSQWCDATSEFECWQNQKKPARLALPMVRNITGKGSTSPQEDYLLGQEDVDGVAAGISGAQCLPLEVDIRLRTPYRTEYSNGTVTFFARNTSLTPYEWGPEGFNRWSAPSYADPDRQVVHTTWATVPQGVYVCANGGNCTAPDTCTCAQGWVGFDCRIPVCNQGYYYPDRVEPRFPGNQGTYHGTPRTLTIWESPDTPNDKFRAYIHNHPNFRSIDPDMDVQLGFDLTHVFRPGPGSLTPPEYTTWEGWRLPGVWELYSSNVQWRQGDFTATYNRTCPAAFAKQQDLRQGYQAYGKPVDDTFDAFSPRLAYTDDFVNASGRWREDGGECVDHVVLGCFNGGQCVQPNTCKCAPGWEGSDCSLPVCEFTVSTVFNNTLNGTDIRGTLLRKEGSDNYGTPSGEPPLPGDTWIGWRKCANNGNCTRPDTCTCEKGWTGADCKTPMCAQECMNGGRCVAPDTCECSQSPSPFIDRRGVPLFQKPNGEPQSTGWTGYDCNTPVCTQALAWIPNDGTGSNSVVLLANTDKTIRNDGTVFQAGCPGGGDYIPVDVRTRVSLKLCNNDVWWQGSYEESWANEEETAAYSSLKSKGRAVRINHPNYLRPAEPDGPWLQGDPVPGEGLYACANGGACTAPDTCSCPPGWGGYDCSVPECTYVSMYRDILGNAIVIRGCMNGGVCYGVKECACPRYRSLLPEVHTYDSLPTDAITGWTASDCSMAICTQGFFDATCRDVPPGLDGVSRMGEGCYRCPNGGNCTAPDTCTCPPEWTGYDCRTPICVQHATQKTIAELATVDQAVIDRFEQDPCGSSQTVEVQGKLVTLGNCTRPNTCACLCIQRGLRGADGKLDESPWADALNRPLPPGVVFGHYDCIDGFEGNLNPDGTFSSCHLKIKVPTPIERYSVLILGVCLAVGGLAIPFVFLVRRAARKRMLMIKAERRRQRREEEAAEKEAKEEEAKGGKKKKKTAAKEE